MRSKIIFLKGLPASGKTTFAKELVEKDPVLYVRLNKDDMRNMLHDGKWSGGREKIIIHAERELAELFLKDGKIVIIDDTNLHDKHKEFFIQLAKNYNADFEERFFDTPLEECIERDKKREKRVGEKVIRDMYNRHLYKPAEFVQKDPALDSAVVIDVDGTLAERVDRSPYDWGSISNDTPRHAVAELMNLLYINGKTIIVVTGRDGICAEATRKWLTDNKLLFHELYTRAEGDKRPDEIVKQEIYENHIKGRYNIDFILDDREKVVHMWRSLGLNCFQVADGNF